VDSSSRYYDHIFCLSFSEGKYVKRKHSVTSRSHPADQHIPTGTTYTYTKIYILRFSPPGFFGLPKCLVQTPGLTSKYDTCSVRVCVYVRIYIHIHPHTLQPPSKIEKIQTTLSIFLMSEITPHTSNKCPA